MDCVHRRVLSQLILVIHATAPGPGQGVQDNVAAPGKQRVLSRPEVFYKITSYVKITQPTAQFHIYLCNLVLL